jgi:hypothetical protein
MNINCRVPVFSNPDMCPKYIDQSIWSAKSHGNMWRVYASDGSLASKQELYLEHPNWVVNCWRSKLFDGMGDLSFHGHVRPIPGTILHISMITTPDREMPTFYVLFDEQEDADFATGASGLDGGLVVGWTLSRYVTTAPEFGPRAGMPTELPVVQAVVIRRALRVTVDGKTLSPGEIPRMPREAELPPDPLRHLVDVDPDHGDIVTYPEETDPPPRARPVTQLVSMAMYARGQAQRLPEAFSVIPATRQVPGYGTIARPVLDPQGLLSVQACFVKAIAIPRNAAEWDGMARMKSVWLFFHDIDEKPFRVMYGHDSAPDTLMVHETFLIDGIIKSQTKKGTYFYYKWHTTTRCLPTNPRIIEGIPLTGDWTAARRAQLIADCKGADIRPIESRSVADVQQLVGSKKGEMVSIRLFAIRTASINQHALSNHDGDSIVIRVIDRLGNQVDVVVTPWDVSKVKELPMNRAYWFRDIQYANHHGKAYFISTTLTTVSQEWGADTPPDFVIQTATYKEAAGRLRGVPVADLTPRQVDLFIHPWATIHRFVCVCYDFPGLRVTEEVRAFLFSVQCNSHDGRIVRPYHDEHRSTRPRVQFIPDGPETDTGHYEYWCDTCRPARRLQLETCSYSLCVVLDIQDIRYRTRLSPTTELAPWLLGGMSPVSLAQLSPARQGEHMKNVLCGYDAIKAWCAFTVSARVGDSWKAIYCTKIEVVTKHTDVKEDPHLRDALLIVEETPLTPEAYIDTTPLEPDYDAFSGADVYSRICGHRFSPSPDEVD